MAVKLALLSLLPLKIFLFEALPFLKSPRFIYNVKTVLSLLYT